MEEAGASLAWLVCSFAVSGTAMFAEPTITEIEEVSGLAQGDRGQRSEVREQKSENRGQKSEIKEQ
jgi:hypothetical protein